VVSVGLNEDSLKGVEISGILRILCVLCPKKIEEKENLFIFAPTADGERKAQL